MFSLLQSFSKKIPPWFLNTWSTVLFCAFIISFWGNDVLQKIKVLSLDWHEMITEFCPELNTWLASKDGKIIITVLIIFTLLVWVMRTLYRPFAILIKHSTMGHNLKEFDEEFSKSFYFKRINIETKIEDSDSLLQALICQDNMYKKINKMKRPSTLFYYGVAHTPFIFRLGYQFGQGKKIRLLHRFRPTEESLDFKELPEHNNDRAPIWNIYSSDKLTTQNLQSSELIVALSTTYPIKPEDLNRIDPNGKMHTLEIIVSDEDRGYDFFSSYDKIKSFTQTILEQIRRFCKEHSTKKIHIVLATSVPFTFYLGQHMHTNQFPDITVYHYNRTYYEWGVSATESDANNAIVHI